jgi:hypothetical protein
MKQSYPVPPLELVQRWCDEWDSLPDPDCDSHGWVATKTAAWTGQQLATAPGTEDIRGESAKLIRSVIERALRDTAPVHWRVADGPEQGAQIVRASDLMAWAEKTASDLDALPTVTEGS